MSYDISLTDRVTKQPIILESKHQINGGTFAIGGTNEATLNVTYNYSTKFVSIFGSGGIRNIYGKTGAESIPMLKNAILMLSDDTDPDYWKPTDGNVKRSLYGLLAFAEMRPDGIWQGD